MANTFLAQQSRMVLEAYANGVGLPASVFASGELTIAERPESAPWPYLVFALSCPGGTVVSVAREYLGVALANKPAHPYQATEANYLRTIAAAIQQPSRPLSIDGPNITWALGRIPEVRSLPTGMSYQRFDAAWLNGHIPGGAFPNGAGRTGENAREIRNRYAVAVVSSAGEPIAIAGAFLSFGLSEIGIDVVEPFQGQGLGVAAVAALTREILDRGETPLYGCAARNIRSQRTAHAVGFVPLLADAVIDG